jgi:ATP/ADP translocase
MTALYHFIIVDYATAFPANADYMSFMGRYSSMTGAATSLATLLGANIVSSLGWRVGALTTPGATTYFVSPL